MRKIISLEEIRDAQTIASLKKENDSLKQINSLLRQACNTLQEKDAKSLAIINNYKELVQDMLVSMRQQV